MSIFDQGITANNATGSASLSGSLSTAAPNRLVILAVAYQSSAAITTAPIIGGAAMTFVRGSTQGTTRLEVWSYFASSQLSSAATLVTLPASCSASMVADAYAGAYAVDATGLSTNTATTGSSGTFTTPVTTGASGDTVVLYGGLYTGSTPSPGSGYTRSGSTNSGSSIALGQYANAATTSAGTVVSVPQNYSPGTAAGSFIALSLSASALKRPLTIPSGQVQEIGDADTLNVPGRILAGGIRLFPNVVNARVSASAVSMIPNVDTFIILDTTAGTLAATLPDPSAYNGPVIGIGCTGTGGAAASVTTPAGSITGSTTVAQGATRYYTRLSDGSGWWQN